MGDRAARAVAVVLHLVDTDDIGVDREDGGNRLGVLTLELGLVVRTTAIHGSATDTTRADRTEGVEVVEQVHPRDGGRAAHVRDCGGSRVGWLEGRLPTERTDRAEPPRIRAGRVATPRPRHDTNRSGDGVPTTQGVGGRERLAAAGPDDRVRVLRLGRVVEQDLVEIVRGLHRQRLIAGGDDIGRLLETTTARQGDLSEPAELVVLGHRQGLRKGDEHALIALGIRHARKRQRDRRRRHRPRAALRQGGHTQLGLALELRDRTNDPDLVTDGDRVVVAVEDEHAVSCRRVTVTGGVLEVEAAQLGRRALVVGDDDPLGRLDPRERCRISRSLDGRNGGVCRAAGRARLPRIARVGVVTTRRRVGTEAVGGVGGEAVPLDRRVEEGAPIDAARAHACLAAQRVVGRADQPAPPLGARVDADLTDHIESARAALEHDRVVAVVPGRRVRLLRLCEDCG